MTALAIAMLAVVLSASAADAAPVTASDPQGDAAAGGGDIVGLKIFKWGSYYGIQVRTRLAIALNTSAAWNAPTSDTTLRFNLEETGDSGIEQAITLGVGGSGPVVNVESFVHSPMPRPSCGIFAQPQPNVIRVGINPGCLNTLTHFRVFARYRLDLGGNSSLDSDDRGPNTGYSPFFTLPN